ncbi:MAG: fibronectin type III domain-containing protein [Syntrophobacteraceae bacterium]
MKRKSLLLFPVWLLLTCMGTGSPAWALAPYFGFCNVESINSPQGVWTQMAAEIYHADPKFKVPDNIKWVIVEGPEGFTTRKMTKSNFSSPYYYMSVRGRPPAGPYTFTVVGTAGESAISYYYLSDANILPNKSSLKAYGHMTAPTLSWSDFPGCNGNLLFQAVVYQKNNRVWASDLIAGTSVTVPSNTLTSGKSYTWGVIAYDNSWGVLTDNVSMTATVPLKAAVGPGFLYARVYSLTTQAGTSTVLDTQVTTPDGNLPADISSLVVTGPNGKTVYSFQAGDYNQSGSNYYHTVSVVPSDGVYTFTATDTAGHQAVSYHYYNNLTLPQVDETSFQASGDPTGPLLTWAAPDPGAIGAPLFYSVTVWDANGVYVWGSQGLGSTGCSVPSNTFTSGSTYQWGIDVQDTRLPYNPNNISRTNRVDLVIDDSMPNFLWGAAVYLQNGPGGISTGFDSYVYNPAGGGLSSSISLVATGPSVFSHTFGPGDLLSGHEYVYMYPGSVPGGTYDFTLTNQPAGQSQQSLVTHCAIPNGIVPIPLPDETTFQVSGSSSAPTVSWSAIQGYPGHLYYMVRVRDSNDDEVYSSNMNATTMQSVPASYLGSGYTYRIEAYNDPDLIVYNNRSNSDWYRLVMTRDYPPGAPTEVTATAGNGQASVSFKAPPDGGCPITRYTVAANPSVKTGGSGKTSPITVKGLTNGTAYTFTVTAANSQGTGPPSQPSAPVTVGKRKSNSGFEN